MRLVCPKCESQYEVDASLFPEEGREVQCSSCEEVWVQYPVAEEPPMRLDPLAVVPAAAAAAAPPPPPPPSERLDEAERSALAEAVAEEIDHRDRTFDRRSSFVDDQGADDEIDDADIVKQLRAQIKAEGGGNFGTTGEAKSQKRNLRVAAEAVGVDVDAVEDDSEKRKWNLSSHDDKAKQPSGRRDGLKEAIARYEEELGPMRPKRRGRQGFIAALVLVAIGAGVFVGKDQIAEAYPPAGPYLEQYAGYVEQGRVMAEELYAEYQPMVMAKIAEFTEGGEDGESQ